jgi:2-iminobutanoate/2-iminopropanoate deaminase
MSRQVIATNQAPAAVGPYSQAIRAGNLVFTAGQIGIDPASGKLADGLENQVNQALANLRAILQAAGSSLDQVVKTTIFLANMDDFAQVNAIYGRAFTVAPPARSTVQAAGLPLGALVEIEVIALVAD